MQPLDDYYLWCDHRAHEEAAGDHESWRIGRSWKRSSGAAGCIRTSGDLRSCCTGCGTIPTSGRSLRTALEHCDMVAATLCGVTDPREGEAKRVRDGPQVDVESEVGTGFRRRNFCPASIRCWTALRDKLAGEYRHSGSPCGASFREVGGEAGTSRREFRFRWARSTRTGMRSARVAAKAMW